MPKKELACIVNHTASNAMDLPLITNNAFDVFNAKNDLFGNALTSKNEMNFLGFSSGFKKVIPSADFLNFPDTANPKSSKSKIIGFFNPQSAMSISLKSDTPFTTVPTSEKMTASSLS